MKRCFLVSKGGLSMTMRDLANHILAVGNSNGTPITNLTLQKVMFFTLGFYIRRNGINDLVIQTYDSSFSKWELGPVHKPTYYRFKHYGSNPISIENVEQDPRYIDLNNDILKLLRINVFKLVEVSHRLPSWDNFEDDILARNLVPDYTLEEIREDFSL